MAECTTQENIEPLNSITGNCNRSKQLYYQLKEAFKTAERIDFIVSFLMESGIKMILPDLRQAVDRGVKIRILTGKYLGITQPTVNAGEKFPEFAGFRFPLLDKKIY